MFSIFKRDKNKEKKKIEDVIGECEHYQSYCREYSRVEVPPPDPNYLYVGYFVHNVKGLTHVKIRFEDRLRHVAVFGGTGLGKTTLLVNMALQDVKNGYGVCFIDPKGDAIEEILTRLPEERLDDLILIDPANYDKVVGLNFLEIPKKNVDDVQREALKEVVVANVVSLFKQQTRIWGERFGRIFETLIRAILDFNERVPEEDQLTFIDLYVLLTDDLVREKFVEQIDDPIIREYLMKINEMTEDVLEPVIRRLNDLVMNKIARQMVTHRKSTLDFREVIDTGKILLVRIPKGEVGEAVMQLVGTAIISKIWAAAKSRVKVPPEERKPFFLYVDEFKNFAFEGSSFDEILSEARAFKLGLTLATQYPSQLSKPIEEAVYANCGTIITFNPQNPKDAKILLKRFPNVKEEDLLSLGPYKALVRIMYKNQLLDPIVITTYPPIPPSRSRDDVPQLAKHSLERYGVERIGEMEISHIVKRIRDLCVTTWRKGLLDELLEVAYALTIKNEEINSSNFKEEAKLRGILVDDRKYNSFLELAEKAGYVELKTDPATGKMVVIPNERVIENAFWESRLEEPIHGFVEHKKLLVEAYRLFTKLGYVVEIPTLSRAKAVFRVDDYCPDLIAYVPDDPVLKQQCYNVLKADKIVVEVEHSTLSRRGLLLRKLATAYKAGFFTIFVLRGHGRNYQEYVAPAYGVIATIENMMGKSGFYKLDEVEVDERGREVWINKTTGELAYLKDRALYSYKDNSYVCTVKEAKGKGWVPKKVEFNPSKEFKDVKTPEYGKDCLVLLMPPETLPIPSTFVLKGSSGGLRLLKVSPQGLLDETEKIIGFFKSTDKTEGSAVRKVLEELK